MPSSTEQHTADIDTAEVFTQSELERQEADALKQLLLAKARKDRREQAAYISAGRAEGGAYFSPGELAARCSAALSTAAKGYRLKLTDAEWTEARSELLARSLGTVAIRRMGRNLLPAERAKLPAAARLFHAPYGTPSSDRRERLLEADAIHAERLGLMPRADGAGIDTVTGMARHILADLLEHRDGLSHAALETLSEVLDTPERHLSKVTADDVAEHIGAEPNSRQWVALQVAMNGGAKGSRKRDGFNLADWAAEQGRTSGAAKVAASKGRDALAKRWPTPAALRADLLSLADDTVDTEQPAAWADVAALPIHPARGESLSAWLERGTRTCEAILSAEGADISQHPAEHRNAKQSRRVARLTLEAAPTGMRSMLTAKGCGWRMRPVPATCPAGLLNRMPRKPAKAKRLVLTGDMRPLPERIAKAGAAYVEAAAKALPYADEVIPSHRGMTARAAERAARSALADLTNPPSTPDAPGRCLKRAAEHGARLRATAGL